MGDKPVTVTEGREAPQKVKKRKKPKSKLKLKKIDLSEIKFRVMDH